MSYDDVARLPLRCETARIAVSPDISPQRILWQISASLRVGRLGLPTPMQYVGIHHGRTLIPMAQKRLNRPDVVAIFKHMRGQGLAQRMAGGGLGASSRPDGFLDRLLEHSFVEMVPLLYARLGIERER